MVSLRPLRVDDAPEVAEALNDRDLHRFIGGEPASVDELRARFTSQVVGHSPDWSEGWLNWVLRDKTSGSVVGTAQATVSRQPEGLVADIAWVVGTEWQGQGRAKDAATNLASWLWNQDVRTVAAHIHPEHAASAGVARSIGMRPTDAMVDGEVRWVLRR